MKPAELKEFTELCHKLYTYDPLEGVIRWNFTNSKHQEGEPAGTRSAGGYKRIYIHPKSYQDSVIAYLLMTGEFHRYVGRWDKDTHNTRWINLYPTKIRMNNNVFPRCSKSELAKFLDGNPLPVGRLATALNTSPHTIQQNLEEMVLDNYLRADRYRVFYLTPEGHREIVRDGPFEESERRDIGRLFQIALPGTLTGNEGPKVLNWELR